MVNKSIPGILSDLGSNLAYFVAVLNLQSRQFFDTFGESVIDLTSGADLRTETRRGTVNSASDEERVNLAPSRDVVVSVDATSGPARKDVNGKADAAYAPDTPLPNLHRQSSEL